MKKRRRQYYRVVEFGSSLEPADPLACADSLERATRHAQRYADRFDRRFEVRDQQGRRLYLAVPGEAAP